MGKGRLDKKIAIVSDQLAGGIGGAESILFEIFELFPEAPTYTTVLNRNIIPEKYKSREFHTSFIQKLPFAGKIYKAYYPLMPLAVELLDLQKYDVIFSSHHCVAKGVISRPDAVHICYCHSPARYIWDLYWTYSDLNKFGALEKIAVGAVAQQLRIWDVTTSSRVDYFLTGSRYTASRIKKFYGRDAEVLHPPVNTNEFNHEGDGDYYLMTGRLVAYKGFELAIEAFNESGKKLVIVGDGIEYKKLRAKAGKNIEMPGRVSQKELISYMNNCKGFIFPGTEDFGIVMAEAQAAGKPVIAFNAGGALDIVVNNETGVLFNEQTVSSLNKAISKVELMSWNHDFISEYARKFDRQVFINRIKYIAENAESFKTSYISRTEIMPSKYWKNIEDIQQTSPITSESHLARSLVGADK